MELILGTAQLYGSYGFLARSVSSTGETAETFLQRAEQWGFTAVDTAPVYPGAEEAIARAEVSLPVHTKLDRRLSPRESIRASLDRLNRSHVEVVYVHDEEQLLKEDTTAIVRAAELIGSKAGMLGSSIYSPEALAASLAHPAIGLIQIPANPLNKVCANLVAEADVKKKVFGRSLLNQGLLVCSPNQIPPQMSHLWPAVSRYQGVCSELGRSPVEVALLWARDHKALDGIIVGAISLAQLEEIASVLRQPPLSPEERSIVDGVEQPPADDMDPRRWK